jgi:septum formation protein
MTDQKLILASASPRRRELIALLGLPFEVVPSQYEEHTPGEHPDPASLAVHLATQKALDVAQDRPGELVLGADTIVVLGNRLYGKPADEADARRMLSELSGRAHEVITGVALVKMRNGSAWVRAFPTRTEVVFRELLPTEIAAYVETGEPLDKAGAYGIQHFGSLLIERIHGDYPNVVGLPITPLALHLRELGIPVLRVAA